MLFKSPINPIPDPKYCRRRTYESVTENINVSKPKENKIKIVDFFLFRYRDVQSALGLIKLLPMLGGGFDPRLDKMHGRRNGFSVTANCKIR